MVTDLFVGKNGFSIVFIEFPSKSCKLLLKCLRRLYSSPPNCVILLQIIHLTLEFEKEDRFSNTAQAIIRIGNTQKILQDQIEMIPATRNFHNTI